MSDEKDKEFLKRYWDEKRARAAEIKELGLCVINVAPTYSTRRVEGSIGHIKVKEERCRIHVTCQFNEEFKRGAAELMGRWRPRTGVWSFSPRSYRLIVQLCDKVYGRDKVQITGKRHLVEGK